MDPSLTVLLAFLPFALSHIGLGVPTVRSALVERLGTWGFTWLFFAVAAFTFALAISTYAGLQGTGTPGPALGRVPVLREVLIGAVVLGIVLMTASLAEFGDHAAAVAMANRALAVARISRPSLVDAITGRRAVFESGRAMPW